MIRAHSFRAACLLPLILCCALAARPVLWPIADNSFWEGKGVEDWGQATVSGKATSALFGFVRNEGYRFHEGIDIAPKAKRDRRGEATDKILAIMEGRVVHISKLSGNSSYGRYVVVEHPGQDVAVCSLYAHLATIDSKIKVGRKVDAGDVIGRMGRSAGGYSIPKSRAHLHLEIALRKTDRFQPWYDYKKFGNKNMHGNYNGMNLTGIDPLLVYEAVREERFTGFADHIRSLPTAFTLRISTRKIPDYITRYPQLMTRAVKPEDIVGWWVEFTRFGLPKQWSPLTAEDTPPAAEGDIALMSYERSRFTDKGTRTLVFEKDDSVSLAKTFRNDMQLIFGFR